MSDEVNLFAQQEANRRRSRWLVIGFILFFAWLGFGGDFIWYLSTAKAAPEAYHHVFPWIGILLTGFGAIIGPLVVWQIKKNEMPFVDDQGKEALNFNITVLILCVGLWIVTIITFGIGLLVTIPAFLLTCLGWLVFTIIAGIKANEGVAYRYPFSIRLIK